MRVTGGGLPLAATLYRTRGNRRRAGGTWRPYLVSLAIVVSALVIPPVASANARPQCDSAPPRLAVPAGGTVKLAPASCTDSDGHPISIEVDVPRHGTLVPSGMAPHSTPRHYTADGDAEGETDVITFRAFDGELYSDDVHLEVSIGPLNRAPVCEDVALSVETGKAAVVPFASCSDADGDPFQVVIEGEPAHGAFDYLTQRYTPATGYLGGDLMTFRAMDAWRGASNLGRIAITVTPAAAQPSPQPPPRGTQQPPQPGFQPPRDVTPPSLRLHAPKRLAVQRAVRRGIGIKATTNEAGQIVMRAFVTRQTARRLKLVKQADGSVAVASLERHVALGTTVLRARMSKTTRRRLTPASRINLRIVATITDAAGNASTTTRRIKLR